jgi:P2-related tail formation protein
MTKPLPRDAHQLDENSIAFGTGVTSQDPDVNNNIWNPSQATINKAKPCTEEMNLLDVQMTFQQPSLPSKQSSTLTKGQIERAASRFFWDEILQVRTS